MVNQINEYIYRIQVRLLGSPLKNMNAYLVLGRERNLLIDTGFNLPETYEDLSGGLAELGVDMEKTDLFLTHCHADHTGLVPRVASARSKIYVSGADLKLLRMFITDKAASYDRIHGRQLAAGFPPEELKSSLVGSPVLRNVSQSFFETTVIGDGEAIDLGGVRLLPIATPGHSPEHLCLYVPEDKILFTGDHVLYDITPNITEWPEIPDSLGAYLDSLEKSKRLDVSIGLPGHREPGDFYARVDSLIAHHEKRLREVETILENDPGATCYEVASRMTWKIRNNSWADFPITQKTFAVGEAMSHLTYLVLRGRAGAEDVGGVLHYRV